MQPPPIASTFVLDDLFVVGLLLVAYGIWLVSSGLRLSELQIAQRAASYSDYSHVDAVQMANEKADGLFGIVYLMAGFGLELFAYLLQIGSGNDYEANAGRAMTALFLLLFVGFFMIVAHRSLRPRLVRRIVVDIARCQPTERGGDAPWARAALPAREVLLGCAAYMPLARRPGEPDEAYVRRVFHVKRTRNQRDAFEPADSPRVSPARRRREELLSRR